MSKQSKPKRRRTRRPSSLEQIPVAEPIKSVDPQNWRVRRTYDEDVHCPLVIEMMSRGASRTEVAAAIGITLSGLRQWARDYHAFAEALELGETLSCAWWERLGRENVGNKLFNQNLWMMHMQNRFGWTRKVEGAVIAEDGATVNVNAQQEHKHLHVHDAGTAAAVLRVLEEAGVVPDDVLPRDGARVLDAAPVDRESEE